MAQVITPITSPEMQIDLFFRRHGATFIAVPPPEFTISRLISLNSQPPESYKYLIDDSADDSDQVYLSPQPLAVKIALLLPRSRRLYVFEAARLEKLAGYYPVPELPALVGAQEFNL